MLMTKVIDIRKIGGDKAVIRLRPNARFSYIAGQYVELTFGECEPRFYSIANAPGQDDFKVHDIEIHIKNNNQGGAASYALERLTPGDVVPLNGPFGASTWTPDASLPLLMIAGGMGIAPLKAVAEDALEKGHKAPVIVYWGVKDAAELYVGEDMDDLAARNRNLKYVSVIEKPVVDVVIADEKNLAAFEIYLAGPPDMIRISVPKLLARGALPERLHSDHEALLKSILAGDI